jgi:hypothetical protein
VSDVEVITFDGVGRLGSFMARSIAYDPRTLIPKGFFFGPVLAPRGGGGLKSFFPCVSLEVKSGRGQKGANQSRTSVTVCF